MVMFITIRWKYLLVLLVLLAASILLWDMRPAVAETFSRRTPVVQAVEKTLPAVVNISTQIVERRTVYPFGANNPFGNDPFFNELFRPRTYTRTYQSLGSGTIVDSAGHVVTNEHVVRGSSQIFITLSDGKVLPCVLIASNPEYDLSVLKLVSREPVNFKPVAMGRSDDLMIGETVIAVGNPYRLDHTVTQGVVSAIDRVISTGDGRELSGLIQTDAAINPGNSGGPLVNINAELIALNTAIRGQGAQNISFAMPVNKVRRFFDESVHGIEPLFSRLGISVQDPSPADAEKLGIKPGEGVVVTEVGQGLAANSGLQRWDIIKDLNGKPASTSAALEDSFDSLTADEAKISYLRNGRTRTAVIKIARQTPVDYPEVAEWFGLQARALDNETAARLGLSLDGGVVIERVNANSPAAKAELARDDYITGVYAPFPKLLPIRTMGDFRKAIRMLGADAERAVIAVTRPGFDAQPLELVRQGA